MVLPAKYRSFQNLVVEPRSYVTLAAGIKLPVICTLAVDNVSTTAVAPLLVILVTVVVVVKILASITSLTSGASVNVSVVPDTE